jgi:NAD(P)-dependent dehydrogenase (short-subunit alcohol dehydrogenase family)
MAGSTQFDYRGQHVLVTGGSNGIGRALADAFVAAGAGVTITGTQAREAYDDEFTGLDYRQLHVEDGTAIDELAADVDQLDVLVNNAGIANPNEAEPAGFAATITVNLIGAHRAATAFHSHLARSKGTIINIASMYSYFGSALAPGYSASKGGIVQLTKSLAAAWAPEGIRVNAIAPGWIVTNLTRFIHDNPNLSSAITARTPQAKWGEPADCTGAVLFLASSAAAFITGAVLNVDGGYSVM